jgi:type III secretion protein Q
VPLPFDLPALSRGFAALSPAATELGASAAEAAARALGALLGRAVEIRGRATPGLAAPRPVAARLSIDLSGVPAAASLEVDPALVAALVDVLAGGTGAVGPATALTPIEAAALELFGLAALDGACSVPPVEEVLAPRLSRGAADPASALGIELEVVAGTVTGHARLLLPHRALGALRGAPPDDCAAPVPVSVRSGRAPLTRDELGALAEGDVVLLDAPGPRPADALVLPGGARFGGRFGEGCFEVEEVGMTERNGEVAVLLEVELARVEVPLSELARLKPGVALPLAIDRRGLVTLRVGERAVARGELVDVEGVIGVRIVASEVWP